MYDDPVLHPNAAGLELLREMATSQRSMEASLAAAREELAEVRGAEVPTRLREQGATLANHHDRIAALESANAAGVEARKPWIYVLGATVTALLSAVSGAMAAWWLGPNP